MRVFELYLFCALMLFLTLPSASAREMAFNDNAVNGGPELSQAMGGINYFDSDTVTVWEANDPEAVYAQEWSDNDVNGGPELSDFPADAAWEADDPEAVYAQEWSDNDVNGGPEPTQQEQD
jgi:hypothetical protein